MAKKKPSKKSTAKKSAVKKATKKAGPEKDKSSKKSAAKKEIAAPKKTAAKKSATKKGIHEMCRPVCEQCGFLGKCMPCNQAEDIAIAHAQANPGHKINTVPC